MLLSLLLVELLSASFDRANVDGLDLTPKFDISIGQVSLPCTRFACFILAIAARVACDNWPLVAFGFFLIDSKATVAFDLILFALTAP